MTHVNEEDDVLEATDEQLSALRDLGVSESELEGLSADDAEVWLAELKAMRESAGRIGRD